MTKVIATHNSSGPFGDADASRVDFQKLRESFIKLPTATNQTDDYLEIDSSVRIIVGKRGAGKTLYLRSIQDYIKQISEEKGSVYLTEIDNEPPQSELITKVTSWFSNDNEADEGWRRIWEVVILRTLYTHFFHSPLKKYVNNRLPEQFKLRYSAILPKNKVPASIFSQLSSLLNGFQSIKDLKSFLNLDEWSDFKVEMGQILKNTPPVYFLIDQVDDDFEHAPYDWLKCQYGLFSQIFRFIRNQTYGGRLHIMVSLREMVYAYILQTPNGNKYLEESKIKVLRWDLQLASHFLIKKIQSLGDTYFDKNGKDKSLMSFFGMKELITHRDNTDYKESVSNYILRHTMLMPRDIINIGNIYCAKKRQSTEVGNNEKLLKASVKNVAKNIAEEQMGICAILISTRWIYNGAVENGNINVYTDPLTIQSIKTNLCSIIQEIGKDRFNKATLIAIKNKICDYGFHQNEDPFNALFISGLLGYVHMDADAKKREVFFSESGMANYALPLHWKEYVFHSSMIDYLGIKAIGPPVYAQY